MERQLYLQHKELCKQEFKVKGSWFRIHAKQIMEGTNQGSPVSFSNSWFEVFKHRHKISLRRATNVSQKQTDDNREALQGIQWNICVLARKGKQTRAVGKFERRQIANVDQTSLPFSFANGEMYADTGNKTVWVNRGASRLDNSSVGPFHRVCRWLDQSEASDHLPWERKRISFQEKV